MISELALKSCFVRLIQFKKIRWRTEIGFECLDMVYGGHVICVHLNKI